MLKTSMPNKEQFQYSSLSSRLTEASLLPYLPVTLTYKGRSHSILGLVDTGATINVLPYQIGVQLGASWDEETASIQLSGNLANYKAQPIIVLGKVGHFDPVRLAFAWTKSEDIPVILGQVNFLMEFNVCFFRTDRIFEIQPIK
jgi:hypothetical protein